MAPYYNGHTYWDQHVSKLAWWFTWTRCRWSLSFRGRINYVQMLMETLTCQKKVEFQWHSEQYVCHWLLAQVFIERFSDVSPPPLNKASGHVSCDGIDFRETHRNLLFEAARFRLLDKHQSIQRTEASWNLTGHDHWGLVPTCRRDTVFKARL